MEANILSKNIEIMSPAGSFAALHAAIDAGAGSVYFGLEHLNMRARSSRTFTVDDLSDIVAICEKCGVKSYMTLNTVIYNEDLILMRSLCDAAKDCGVSAVIASDIAVMEHARSIGLEVHISTQANVSNIEAVKFYSRYADVVVLARELSLEQIAAICSAIKDDDIRGPSGELIKVELFVHGALCVGISGKCYMSLAQYNASANRGECLQSCRRKYRVTDDDTGDELIIDNEYVMSPKDLCTIGALDKILAAGVTILKLEGRGRPPEYVHTVTKTYHDAVDSVLSGTYSPERVSMWKEQLATVYNRGFWHGGYYLGKDTGEWAGTYGSQATTKKEYIGKVTNYFKNIGVAEFKIESGAINDGDEIIITGDTTGMISMKVSSLRSETKTTAKGDVVTFPVVEKVRKNDKLFIIVRK
ncbi:MAG: U32 family peptidase [Waddliaceae bacterium]|jgi:U32 family peptidase|nr:U32 family peptidase [Waddliaceae bacterium]MBT3578529.1 U32 family peptidase [Waddliaceae bacterium]MBT4445332.1 U32 family peptidase [Waddliaceae bacterium]MBT6928072.1 U32 family peptidase [Waddliaceae bacterium]MBT7264188.1 U32 family peptidase [Waddliaceae bacterium]